MFQNIILLSKVYILGDIIWQFEQLSDIFPFKVV